MRVKSLKITGLKPLYRSSGKKEIYIDFNKCKHKIVLIIGPNGSGKSTIMNALQPLPESPSLFLDKEKGEKIIEYEFEDIIYIVKIIYPVTSSGQRLQTKAFLTKVFSDGNEVELNPNGNIGSYKDALYSEFKLDPNFVSLSQLSTEDRGIVEKTPSERKKYVGYMLEEIQVYNDIHKALVKRSSIFKSMINSITAKINSVGERDILTHELESVDSSLQTIQNNIDYFTKIISDNESMIKLIDPDGSIQQKYAQLNSEKNRIIDKIKDIKILMGRFITKYPDVDTLLSYKKEVEEQIREFDNSIIITQDRLSELLVSKEEDFKAFQIKQQKVEAMKSEFVVEDLKETIFSLRDSVAHSEAVFKQIGIVDMSITKDEYITGLNILKEIKDMVTNMRSFSTNEAINESIRLIRENGNVIELKRQVEKEVKDLRDKIEYTKQQISFFRGLLTTTEILSKRPRDCVDDTCPFISNALDASKKEPQKNIDMLESDLVSLEDHLKESLNRQKDIEDLIETYQTILSIIRNIRNNSSILIKLPNGDLFSDTDKFLDAILNGSTFNEINQLYRHLQSANLFETYQNEKEQLLKMEYEYKLHENKIAIIEEISEDITRLREKMNGMEEKIYQYQQEITDNKKKKEDKEKELQNILSLKEMYEKLTVLQQEESLVEQNMNKMVSDMKMIEGNLKVIANANEALIREKSDITPLQNKKDKIKFSLNKLDEYEAELSSYNAKYNTIEIIKKYSSPTKGGIQTLFMKLYMSKTLEITNELLSYLFQGELQLLPYVINDSEFRIPCKNINSSVINDDISSCSSAEKSMISMILSFALLKQSSTKYNILKMDEIDGALDQYNRSNFLTVLNIIMEQLEIENCFLVSHSSEIDMSDVDIILLSDHNDYGYSDNIIFSFEK